MRYKEFRIIMPMTVDEYRIGQLYGTCEMSRNETGAGDGVEVLVDEPYEGQPLWHGQYGEGQYTFKKYYMYNKVNAFVRKIAPKGSLEFEEYAWNAYPYCRTILKNEAYMKDKFEIKIESMHCADKGTQENVHKLDAESLKQREVVFIDIASKKVPKADDQPNIREFKSFSTNRGPLGEGWQEREDLPFMCCYKLVSVNFEWWGLQRTIEKMILKNQKKLFAKFNRSVFLWIDKWHAMTLEDVRQMEKETKEDLARRRQQSIRRGTGMD